MNRNQKIVAVSIVLVLLGMLLFPPFHLVVREGTFNVGFSFIFNPPQKGTAIINTSQWLIQILVVGIIGGITWFLFKNRA